MWRVGRGDGSCLLAQEPEDLLQGLGPPGCASRVDADGIHVIQREEQAGDFYAPRSKFLHNASPGPA